MGGEKASKAQIQAVRIKLKPGCIDQAKQWAAEINARKQEALASLKNEGIIIEAAFLDRMGEDYYLIYIMKGAIDASKSIAAASQSPVDVYHRNFKKTCWESSKELEFLVWLEEESV